MAFVYFYKKKKITSIIIHLLQGMMHGSMQGMSGMGGMQAMSGMQNMNMMNSYGNSQVKIIPLIILILH